MTDNSTPSFSSPDRLVACPWTIGLLVGSAEDKYENALLRGISDVARPLGANLICFTSGALRSYHGFEAQRNVLYDLISADRVDGLIISGTLGHSVYLADLQEFCRRYDPLPLVSIAVALTDIPSVMVDSREGMRAIVQHMLDVHSYRRVAFLRGPRGQQEAEERYHAYVDVLLEHGIAVDPALVLDGDYTYASGAAAMQSFLDQGRACQAVVAANDSMALGVLSALQQNGRQVPHDLAVTGFDDTEAGQLSLPPLTTVRQSAYVQGRAAAQVLLVRLRGEQISPSVIIPGTPIVRQSCGCPEQSVAQAASPIVLSAPAAEAALAAQRAPICAALTQAAALLPEELAAEWTAQLFDAFAAEAVDQRSGLFLAALTDLIQHSQRADDDGSVWHPVLSTLRTQALPLLNVPQRLLAESLWQQARTLVGESARLWQARQRAQAERRAEILREIGEAMITSFNLADVLDAIAWELPRLGVTACYLALFENPKEPAGAARLILAYDVQGRQALPLNGEPFAARLLVPPGRLHCAAPYNLVVEALYSKEERLGFALFEVSAPQTIICGALRGQLSSALLGVLLLEQRREVEAALQRQQNQLEALVEQRTLALREANVELSGRNAELERFTYTVSHDLKAPLITIRGFLGFVEQDARAGNWERLQADFTRISEATDKMRRLLDELLELSRIGRMMNPPETLPFETIVAEALRLAHGRLEERGVQVEVVAPLPLVCGDHVRLVEVVQNLLDNAAKFMGDQVEPRITIGQAGTDRAGKPIVFVRDNGIWIDSRYHDRVFGLFDKLDATSDGTGVGLALVKRIIEVHGGRIWVESEGSGRGATFFFTLPQSEAVTAG